MQEIHSEPLLSPEEVAEWLNVKPSTLEKWRHLKRGPEYIEIGGLRRYQPTAVKRYIAEQTVTGNAT